MSWLCCKIATGNLRSLWKTKMEYHTKKQRAGRRQGCSLSPDVFVVLTSIVGENVKYRLQNPRNFRTPSSSLPIHRVYYADDTILIATSTRAANNQLAEAEWVSLSPTPKIEV